MLELIGSSIKLPFGGTMGTPFESMVTLRNSERYPKILRNLDRLQNLQGLMRGVGVSPINRVSKMKSSIESRGSLFKIFDEGR